MADRIASVEDIPEWLAKQFPFLTALPRAAYNAARLPSDIGIDAASRGLHGALGLDEAAPGSRTGARVDSALGALRDLIDPAARVAATVGTQGERAADTVRQRLIEAGATPKAAAAPPSGSGAFAPGTDDYRFNMDIPEPAMSKAATPARRVVTAPVTPPGETVTAPTPVVAGPNTAVTAAPDLPAARPVVPPPDPVRDLAAEYRRRVDAVPRNRSGALTPEQADVLKTQFFLQLLAKGAQRTGKGLLGNAGEAGSDVTEKARLQMEKNTDTGRKDHADEIQRIATELGLMDKTDDNKAKLRQIGITEAHYASMDERDKKRLDIELKKAGREGWEIVKRGKKGGGGTLMRMNKYTGEIVDTGIPIPSDGGAPDADDRKAARMRAAGVSETDIIDRLYPGNAKRNVIPIDVDTGERDAMGAPIFKKGAYNLDSGEFIEPGKKTGPTDVAKPTTRAEFDALPKGAKFINPKDGKTYTKKD